MFEYSSDNLNNNTTFEGEIEQIIDEAKETPSAKLLNGESVNTFYSSNTVNTVNPFNINNPSSVNTVNTIHLNPHNFKIHEKDDSPSLKIYIDNSLLKISIKNKWFYNHRLNISSKYTK